jgi:hypothetical protein
VVWDGNHWLAHHSLCILFHTQYCTVSAELVEAILRPFWGRTRPVCFPPFPCVVSSLRVNSSLCRRQIAIRNALLTSSCSYSHLTWAWPDLTWPDLTCHRKTPPKCYPTLLYPTLLSSTLPFQFYSNRFKFKFNYESILNQIKTNQINT